MSFSRLFKVLTISTALIIGVSHAAKPSGKVRYTVGDATIQKRGVGDWHPVRMGNKVVQNDNIRTELEAQVIISLPDGSSLTINENTFVAMMELFNDKGINRTSINIKNGKIKFDVEKQTHEDSHVKFKTGTSSAAIRGTKGIIGVNRLGQTIASLKEGKLDIETIRGQKLSIVGGQAAVPYKDSLIIVTLKAPYDTDLINKIDTLSCDTTLTIEEFIHNIAKEDSIYFEKINSANKVSPTITTSSPIKPIKASITKYDSLRCTALISFSNEINDQTIFTTRIDGIARQSEIIKGSQKTIATQLTKGEHLYEFAIEDPTGYKNSVSKTIGCYPPLNGVSINLKGSDYELLRVPPPPQDSKNTFPKTMQFSVKGLPQNDPIYIKQITISQQGKKAITLRGTDIQSTHLEQQVELLHGQKNPIEITVLLKNGKTLKATKIYEVR